MNVFTALIRLGADPEQKFLGNDKSVVTFNGAVDSGFGDKKVTTWIRFQVWGKKGDTVMQYLAKGSQAVVSGELTNRKWADKEGQDRYSLEVDVNSLSFVGGKSSSQHGEQEPTTAQRSAKSAPADFDDDDIPFN